MKYLDTTIPWNLMNNVCLLFNYCNLDKSVLILIFSMKKLYTSSYYIKQPYKAQALPLHYLQRSYQEHKYEMIF